MREKVFTGAVLIVIAFLCVFMPKISSKLKPKPVFTQEFAAGIVEEVLEEDLFPDPAVRGKFRGTQNCASKSLKERTKIGNSTYIIP